ncbi:speckle-type POZ protein-like [Panonychus citri]|uniref:speckle-type POZ protein-like n=1 Tax=Panonychus citri TaxID=50023 RepID=UPI002307DDCA|nr:speckle-type POZ protein-like [Panonychus citri]XP_053200374.1 speckle-type POZ protein-like [Panonychus citri]
MRDLQSSNNNTSNSSRFRVFPTMATSHRRAQASLMPSSQSISLLPVTKFSHLWTIKNFSYIPSDTEFICCPNFSPPASKDKWFMKLRPKTLDETSGIEYIGIHLFLRSCEDRTKQQVRAKYVISVLDAEGDPRYTGECSRHEGRIFKAGTEGHGYKLLAPRELLLNPANNMLGTEDSLRILCEITMFGEVTSSLVPCPDNEHIELTYPEEALARHSVTSDLANFFTNGGEKTDIILEGKDKVQVKAHKIILSIRSKVIGAMFSHETKEKAESKIEIKDIDGAVLREMINFIYTDKVGNLEEYACDLLIAADKYDLPKLKMLCEQYLASKVTIETSGEILALADACNSIELKDKCLEFVVRNSAKIVNADSWDTQVGKRPSLFKEAFELMAKRPRPN